jgi:anti-sigma regulatory factor (Ser/Thr protein kinase)
MTRFDHPALLYRDTDEYLATTVPFIRTAVEAGDSVLVAVPAGNLTLLRGALGGVGGCVEFADMAESGRNPGRILPAVLLPFAEAHRDRHVSIIGEPVWPGRTPSERTACTQHEALINTAFEGRDAAVLCPYDTARLDRAVVADAWRTHPTMIDEGSRIASGEYDDPLLTAEAVNLPLPPPARDAVSLRYSGLADLAVVRRFIRRRAAPVLPAERVEELVLAVHELATNTIRHAGGPGLVTIWVEAGVLACQVEDRGHIADPLAGRRLPPPLSPCGRGLLLVNQLCDLVRIRSGPGGTCVRVHMWVAADR